MSTNVIETLRLKKPRKERQDRLDAGSQRRAKVKVHREAKNAETISVNEGLRLREESVPADDDAWTLVSAALDTSFYRKMCPDLPSDADPTRHYLTQGWQEGLDPNPEFSTRFYLERCADVRRHGINPFYHYLKWGRHEGRAPKPGFVGDLLPDDETDIVGAAFNVDYYLTSHPELIENGVDPLRHYLAFGAGLGWDPTPAFSTTFYLERSPDVRKAGLNPFYHYLRWGQLEGRAPSPAALDGSIKPFDAAAELIRSDFDSDFYSNAHPELIENHVEPLLHFLHFGWQQGFNPSADFSTAFYLQSCADVRASGENPLHHYCRAGKAEGRMPKPPLPQAEGVDKPDYLEGEYVELTLKGVFDTRYYLERYPDISAGKLDPLKHYLSFGWTEGRDPAPWFSTATYLRLYPGVAATRMNPLFHWVVWGRDQGYATVEREDGTTRAKLVPGSRLVTSRDIAALRHCSRDVSGDGGTALSPASLNVHWVIPDFDAGGGGHMTIFRMVRWLEFFGHRCNIWVQWPAFERTDAEREELILKRYQTISASVRTLSPGQSFPGADALIATSWDTAYLVASAKGAKKKFYFVQDYEPFFNPVGARSLAAELTYGLGYTCICASPWLERKMRDQGSEAHGFMLAADECYVPPVERRRNEVPRIAVYARTHTPRRATELSLLALEILAERGERFSVDFFGTHEAFKEAPFPATNWGIIDATSLAQLYGEADLGVCFSATNYSLVPQEMMACGLPVVELATESTREAYPAGVVLTASPDPYDIADKISLLLRDDTARRELAKRGASWVRTLTWEKAAQKVEQTLLSYLATSNELSVPAVVTPSDVKVSVIIPTYNGGVLFQQVLNAVRSQRAPWLFEVIAIDSNSTDGTGAYTAGLDDDKVRAISIAKHDFQHGRTRNFGAELARGTFVAFLTQDALPADEFWLYNLVLMLERFPTAAGTFGRHLAWPDASPYIKREIANHFAIFDRHPLCVSRYTDVARWREGDPSWRRFLHYYSDNNSCLRRSVWERIPLPDVDYAEDQLWADRIIRAGYGKVYAPLATVYHSHDYDETKTFERARTDAEFFRRNFGYDLGPQDLRAEVRSLNVEDERWGRQNGVDSAHIARQKRLNVVRLAGLAAGATDGVTFASAF